MCHDPWRTVNHRIIPHNWLFRRHGAPRVVAHNYRRKSLGGAQCGRYLFNQSATGNRKPAAGLSTKPTRTKVNRMPARHHSSPRRHSAGTDAYTKTAATDERARERHLRPGTSSSEVRSSSARKSFVVAGDTDRRWPDCEGETGRRHLCTTWSSRSSDGNTNAEEKYACPRRFSRVRRCTLRAGRQRQPRTYAAFDRLKWAEAELDTVRGAAIWPHCPDRSSSSLSYE